MSIVTFVLVGICGLILIKKQYGYGVIKLLVRSQ